MNDGAADPSGEVRLALDGLLDTVPGAAVVALGWATVDLDRVELAFAETYPGSVGSTVDLGVDPLLGARCRRILPGIQGVPAIVLLEPSTEGRLAATLARHGEGPAAIWLTLLAQDDRARSVVASGPFGPEILWLDGPVTGPHRLVVLAGPGTITP